MKKDMEVLHVLQSIQRSLNSLVESEDDVHVIFEECRKFIGFDYYCILIKNENEKSFCPFKLFPNNVFDLPPQGVEATSGFINWIDRNKKSLQSPDVTKELKAQYQYLTLKKDEKSFLGVPLIKGNKVSGIFIILSKEKKAFTDRDQIIFENIGNLIVTNLLNRRYFDDIVSGLNKNLKDFQAKFKNKERMIKKLSLLSEASNTLLAEFENKTLEEKFDFIVEKTCEILDAELCSLFLKKENNIVLATSYSIEDRLRVKKRAKEKVVLPIKTGPKSGQTGHIAYSKKVFNAFGKELREHPAVKDKDATDFLPSNYNYSELAYPMLDKKNELLGILIAYNKLDESGKPLFNVGFSQELDELLMKNLTSKLIISMKNAELVNKLSDSLSQLINYELLIENIPDPVAIISRNGQIEYLNEGGIKLYGDLKGKSVSDYYFTDEISTGREKAKEIMRKLLENRDGRIKNIETVFTNIEGKPIPVSLSASLLKNEKGKVVGSIGISKDLSEIKALIEVGNSLLSTYNVYEILNKISNECLKLPKSNRAYMKLYDEKLDGLVYCALRSRNPNEELPREPSPKDRGMTGYVFITQKPYFSGGVSLEPSERYYKIFSDVKSEIVVPINSIDKNTGKTKTVGVICIDSNKPNAFSVNDTYFLSTLANQTAAAIETANLITSKTKIITELTALEKIQETITKTLEIDQILDGVLDVVVDTLGFDYATISQVKHSKGMIGTVKGRGVSQEFIDMSWHPLNSNDIQACVIRNKKEVKLSGWDIRLDKKIYERFNHKNLVRIYLPIQSRDEVYGTLEAGYNKKHRQDIFNEEIVTLRKITNLAGIGMAQTYSRREQQKLGDQLQELNQANVYIQSSRTEAEVVNHIFRSLKQIGYSKVMLSLVNETTGNIEGRYASGANWEEIKNETKRDLTGNDILALVIKKKQSILSKDCTSDFTCDQSAIRKSKIKSQYVIPIIINVKAIGTLQIDLTDKQGLVLGRDDVLNRRMEVLETFASQIAIAIRNVRDRGMINLLETTITETAHEFRSPLHNILTQIGGLKNFIPEELETEKQINNIFKIISEEAHRASRQMENTLLLSDRSRDLLGFNFEKGYIQYIIQDYANKYSMKVLEREISIVIRDNVKKLPPFIFDKIKIEQVINNLIDNAIKYSQSNRFIQIQGFDDGTKIHIDFWNKGLGIPESEFDNLFQDFTRSTYKDKKRYIPGTGLGLKICKEIVEGHGGEIKVKSTPFTKNPNKIREYIDYDTIITLILPKRTREK